MPHGHAAVGGVDEQLGGATADVAAEDVAAEQVAGMKVWPWPAAMPSAELAPGRTMSSAVRDAPSGVASAVARASSSSDTAARRTRGDPRLAVCASAPPAHVHVVN
jgi:hypothetical protein